MNSVTLEKPQIRVDQRISWLRMPETASAKIRPLVIATAVFIVFAILLNRWLEPLEQKLGQMRRDYEIDLDLARHKSERLALYQKVVGSSQLPAAAKPHTNEWIREVQSLVDAERLVLRELKPVYGRTAARDKNAALLLEVEGKASDLYQLLYRIGAAEDATYVSKLVISGNSDGSELVRAKITLGQV